MGVDFQVTMTHPERRTKWLAWLGTDTVCVRTPFPQWVQVETLGQQLAFILDEAQLTPTQRHALCRGIAAEFDASVAEVTHWMHGDGVVILAQDCHVTVYHPFRWFDVDMATGRATVVDDEDDDDERD